MQVLLVQEPWFSEIKQGRKTVEGRTGHPLKFYHCLDQHIKLVEPKTKEFLLVHVTHIRHYPDLYSYITAEGWQQVAPQCKNNDIALQAYRQVLLKNGQPAYSDLYVQQQGGVIALSITPITDH